MWHLRGLIQSKPNPNIEQTKPLTQYRANQTHGHVARSSLVIAVACSSSSSSSSSLIANRSVLGAPSLIADSRATLMLSARCSCSLPQGVPLSFSLWLSLSLSLSLSHSYLNLKWKLPKEKCQWECLSLFFNSLSFELVCDWLAFTL